MEPGRTLVLHQPADPETRRPLDRHDPDLGNYYGSNWAFVLEESDGGSTRLIVHSRVDGRPRVLIGAFYTLLIEFPHFVMEREMLKGIKERAQRPRILRVKKMTSGPIGSGTRFVLVSRAMGQPMAVEYEITTYEPPESCSTA